MSLRAGRKTNERSTPSGPRPPRGKPCGVENCVEITAKGKPFCFDHLDLMQRADSLIAEVNARNEEIERVLAAGTEGWSLVDVKGSVAQDILGIIEVYGPQTVRTIARAATLTQAVVVPYVKALRSRGLVQVAPVRVGDSIEEKVSPA